MSAATSGAFGLSVGELAIFVGVIAYVASLLRDWRPVKALRAENRDLRELYERAQTRIGELEREVKELQRATNLSILHDGQTKTVEALQAIVDEVRALDMSVKANTAAVEVLAKRQVIDDAIKEGDLTK